MFWLPGCSERQGSWTWTDQRVRLNLRSALACLAASSDAPWGIYCAGTSWPKCPQVACGELGLRRTWLCECGGRADGRPCFSSSGTLTEDSDRSTSSKNHTVVMATANPFPVVWRDCCPNRVPHSHPSRRQRSTGCGSRVRSTSSLPLFGGGELSSLLFGHCIQTCVSTLCVWRVFVCLYVLPRVVRALPATTYNVGVDASPVNRPAYDEEEGPSFGDVVTLSGARQSKPAPQSKPAHGSRAGHQGKPRRATAQGGLGDMPWRHRRGARRPTMDSVMSEWKHREPDVVAEASESPWDEQTRRSSFKHLES